MFKINNSENKLLFDNNQYFFTDNLYHKKLSTKKLSFLAQSIAFCHDVEINLKESQNKNFF